MYHRFFLGLSFFLLAIIALEASAQETVAPVQAQQKEADAGFVPLFDGKTLQGWTSARSSGKGDWGAFSVNEQEQAIHVYAGREANSKQETDCLNTTTSYSHYIFKLEYKWLESRFAPRTDWDRDAGLLFHVHGDLKKVWPLSLEMQIGESAKDKKHGKGNKGRFHTGDLFVLGKHLRTDTPLGADKHYSADGKMKKGRSVKTGLGTENPKGEWNQMEIHVHGSEKATFMLNGEVVLETFKFEQHGKNGEQEPIPVKEGRIGLQAEWAELMYRKLMIKELPAE